MLSLPNPPHYAIIDAADLQPSTKRKYKIAIDSLILAGVDPRNSSALSLYAQSLPGSSRAFLKSALRVLFMDTATQLKANATAENLPKMQAALLNLEAMEDTIKVHKPEGSKSHLWLTPEQVERITALPDRSTVQGRRDWIVLALLLSGLRREEAATITFNRLVRRPMSNGQLRAVLEVTGKGATDRTVPINPLLEDRLNDWKNETGDGNITRAINKSGRINGSLSAKSIYEIVQKYGAMIGLPELQPHDLRRTYAQIGWQNTRDLVLVQTLLGHKDPQTTIDYLDLKTNFDVTISDYIPLS